jgi:hypothetical protein
MEDGDIYPKYRLYAQKVGDNTVYSIHETVYDFDATPMDYVKVPVSMIQFDLDDMIGEIEQMLNAFDYDLISIEDFPEQFQE